MRATTGAGDGWVLDFWSPSRFWRRACWPAEGWGTLGMGADRARSGLDFGSDAVDARVGDPRPRRDAFGDARRRGRPPRDAPAPRGPGVLQVGFACVRDWGAPRVVGSTGLGGGKRTGVSSEAILAPLLSVVMLVTGAAAGAAGGSGMARPGTGWSIGGIAGPEEPPKMALIMDGLGTAAVRAGRAIRAPAEVLTPRVAARRALERTISNPERGATLRRYGRTRGLICATGGSSIPARVGSKKIFPVGFSSRFLAGTQASTGTLVDSESTVYFRPIKSSSGPAIIC